MRIYYSIGLSGAGMSIIYVIVLCSINFHQIQKDTIIGLIEDNSVEKAKIVFSESKKKLDITGFFTNTSSLYISDEEVSDKD